MRRSVMLPFFLLIIFLGLFFLPHPALASRDKMILPDPFDSGPGTDAVLVMDVSGSMKQSDPEYLCRRAAVDFITKLGNTPFSRAALITFSDSIQKVIPLTVLDASAGEATLTDQIQALEYTSGDTDIGAAMEKAVSLLLEEKNVARARCILLLTDGEIDLPGTPDEEEAEKQSLTKTLMAVEDAKKNGIVIHTVALDLSDSLDENLMNYMADSTGGSANRVSNALSLEKVFLTLSEYAANLSRQVAETEAETDQEEVMTEEETEAETETETETERQAMVIQTIGTVDGPVELKGLLPSLCSATLRLSDLFSLNPGSGNLPGAIRYTAWADDNSLLTCTVKDDLLSLTGIRNGNSNITVIAQPYLPENDQDLAAPGYGIEESFCTSGGEESATLSFPVEVRALIPSPWYLALIPACVALLLILIWFARREKPAQGQLSGYLQWYVRGENEKIFGMPSQIRADLKNYGKKVRLGDLIQDDVLTGADLNKVSISASGYGIRLISRTSSILLAMAGSQPSNRLDIPGSGRFKVFCETNRGKAVVIALYTSETQYKTEPSCEDDSDERTRLLV